MIVKLFFMKKPVGKPVFLFFTVNELNKQGLFIKKGYYLREKSQKIGGSVKKYTIFGKK